MCFASPFLLFFLFASSSQLYAHLCATQANECPLSTWGRNSRIDHGVSDTITGPYTLKDVAIPTWAHNSAPIALKDGTYAIVHIGDGTGAPNGGTNCNKTGWELEVPFDPRASLASSTAAAAGSTIHVSKSLDGPWTPLSPNTLGNCNNPAPWVHSNGTIYM